MLKLSIQESVFIGGRICSENAKKLESSNVINYIFRIKSVSILIRRFNFITKIVILFQIMIEGDRNYSGGQRARFFTLQNEAFYSRRIRICCFSLCK